MTDEIQGITAEPELTKRAVDPKGVLQKNLKPMLYLGAALLVIVAAIFSGTGKKTATQKSGTPNQPPQPMLQDSTDNNVQDLKNQVAAAQQKAAQQPANPADPSLADATPAQQAAAQAYGPTASLFLASPASRARRGSSSFHPPLRRNSSSRPRTASLPSILASHRILSLRARLTRRSNRRRPRSSRNLLPARQRAVSLRRAPQAIRPLLRPRRPQPSAGRRSISTLPQASPM